MILTYVAATKFIMGFTLAVIVMAFLIEFSGRIKRKRR